MKPWESCLNKMIAEKKINGQFDITYNHKKGTSLKHVEGKLTKNKNKKTYG